MAAAEYTFFREKNEIEELLINKCCPNALFIKEPFE